VGNATILIRRVDDVLRQALVEMLSWQKGEWTQVSGGYQDIWHRYLPMPSIEIVAVGQLRPIEVNGFPFAVVADTKLKSHRSPRPRFQEDFDRMSGIMYHLGNPSLKGDSAGRCFFAYKLLSDESKNGEADFLEFSTTFRSAAETMLAELIVDSPSEDLIFTSDWQFGPDWTKREAALSLSEFWKLHDSRRLLLNALYPIKGR
jgi:hypothetical protein